MSCDLTVLRTLSPKSLSVMRSLHIALTDSDPALTDSNPAPLIDKDQPCLNPMRPSQSNIEAIDGQSLDGKMLIKKWTDLCQFLSCSMATSRLYLSISCAARDIDTALVLMEPLKKLPLALGPAIFLNPDPDKKQFKDVAMNACYQFQGQAVRSQALPVQTRSWADLPLELHLKILGYTDLVTHWPRELYKQDRTSFEINAGTLLPRVKRCCKSCTSTRSVCCCPSKYAAYSTTCTCITLPSSLFRVSKIMSAEAQQVFYSQNDFTLTGDFGATQRFLASLSPVTRQQLRIVSLAISYDQLSAMPEGETQVAHDWCHLISCLNSILPLQNIDLTIIAGDNAHDIESWRSMEFSVEPGDNYYGWLRDSYEIIFAPVYQHLTGIKMRGFNVLLQWWPDFEGIVERKVMGPQYNSEDHGKPPWTKRFPPSDHYKYAVHGWEYGRLTLDV